MIPTTTNNNPPNQSLVISYLTLRKAVGILGMALPIVLVLGNFALSDCNSMQYSISDYFYTKMGPYFIGTLCAVGLFLFSYNGYTRRDTIAGKLSCLFALGVAFDPTSGPSASSACNFLHRNSNDIINTVHLTSAALLFLTLSYFSLVLFTKTSGNPTPEKLKRNIIYRICGWTMLGSIAGILLISLIPQLHQALGKYNPVLVLETSLLWAFGFSWLTKGEAILKDK